MRPNTPQLSPDILKLVFRLNVENVRLLSTVIEHGSPSEAADHAGISRSSMSKRLTALENLFDQKLLEKTATGYVGTEFTKHLLELIDKNFYQGVSEIIFGEEDFGLYLFAPADERKNLDRDFGLTTICQNHMGQQRFKVIEVAEDFKRLKSVGENIAVSKNNTAFADFIEKSAMDRLGMREVFELEKCIAVAHATHPLAFEQDIDDYLLATENIASVAGANFLNTEKIEYMSSYSVSNLSGVVSALAHLNRNPSNLILVLPTSALNMLKLYPNVQRLSTVPALTREGWNIYSAPTPEAQNLASLVVSTLKSPVES